MNYSKNNLQLILNLFLLCQFAVFKTKYENKEN